MSNIFDSMLKDQAPEPQDDSSDHSSLNDQSQSNLNSRSTDPSHVASATPLDVKLVAQELLKNGCIEESGKNSLFQKAMTCRGAVESALEPLDLAMRVDEIRGVAFLIVRPDESVPANDEWSHPLVRRQRLTLEQSLLLAILRQAFMAHEQELGVGETQARIAVDDLLPQFRTFFGETGSDQKDESRLLNVLDQLKTHGVISEVDKNQELIIRPLIAHLADPASLNALLRSFQNLAESGTADEGFDVAGERDVK